MSKQKKNSRRHSRIRFPFPALNIGNIIFGALFFYMAVSLFFYLTADHIKSFQVVQGTLSRNDTYTAFAMRTESVQLSSGSGYVQFYTPNASKISRGSAVYGISATENADTSGISADAATRTSLRSSLARFSSDYDSSSFSGIYQLKTELSAKLLAAAAENGDSSSQTIFYADQTVLSSTAVMDMKAIRRTALRRSFSLRKPLWFPLIPARRRSLEMQYTVW